MARVLEAARQIGFYGLGALQHRVEQARRRHRLGVIIQNPHHPFSELLERHLIAAAEQVDAEDEIRLRLEHLDDLSPETVAARMLALAEDSDALAVLAAEHPLVTDAIDQLAARGVPVIALISSLSARSNVGYVGLDSWKVGRTAAWTFDHLCAVPGKLGILVGTHRYRCHDLYESGFRSYFREHTRPFTLLEPMSTFESDAIARELTERLLREHPDLQGLYVSGGGISGVLAAVRASGHAGRLVTVGHDLMDTTKAGLLDGSLTLVISHAFEQIARETLTATLRARQSGPAAGSQSVLVPFQLYTRENI
jgi:LacI family transcriptional regulator